MTCPVCNSTLTRNRSTLDMDDYVVRHKMCLKCGYKWKTVEVDKDMIDKKGNDEDADARRKSR